MLNRSRQWKLVLAGAVGTVLLILVCGWVYLRFGAPPVAVADRPFPDEEQIVHIPLNARIDRQMTTPPFQASAEDMDAGAHIYIQQCAMCHGTPNRRSGLARAEYPPPPQLWAKNRHGGIGVSDDPAGKVFWEVDDGIRLTAMPAFNKALSEKQEWQVSLLVQAAGQPLPAEAMQILNAGYGGPSAGDPQQPDPQESATH